MSKKGKQKYTGIILNILLAILLNQGGETLFIKREMKEERIENQVLMFELLLGIGEWLKSSFHTQEKLEKLPAAINSYLNILNITYQCSGMGLRLIKNHLYFHFPLYMKMLNPSKG